MPQRLANPAALPPRAAAWHSATEPAAGGGGKRRFSVVVEPSEGAVYSHTVHTAAGTLSELAAALAATVPGNIYGMEDPQLEFFDLDFGEFVRATTIDDWPPHT